MTENKQDNKCQLCGESMPVGEDMFNYHGYSGPCPKPPLRRTENDYVAWVHYHNGSILTCDSDAKGAFKVYRRGQLKEIREKFAKSHPIEALFFEQWLKEIGESTI